MISETQATLSLSGVPGLGIRRFLSLIAAFGTAAGVFRASRADLAGVEGISPDMAERLAHAADFSQADAEIAAAEKAGATLTPFTDPLFPPSLRQIYDPPFALYFKGNARPLLESPCVAVVGTRGATAYGRAVTESVVSALARAGVAVVSGLASGIDTAAHEAALKAGGFTAAVLGTGVDVAYPEENAALQSALAGQGALISEFPMGTPPDRPHFPRRNRLISGLCRAVLVVEAGKKSGALITSDFAAEQGVHVFAVPGNINSPKSEGTNALLRDGALACLSAEDILLHLGRKAPSAATPARPALAPEEGRIASLLDNGPLHIDEIIRRSGGAHTPVHSLLVSLELKGAVRQGPGMIYARAG